MPLRAKSLADIVGYGSRTRDQRNIIGLLQMMYSARPYLFESRLQYANVESDRKVPRAKISTLSAVRRTN